jgi:hypothetical protein
MFVWRGLRKTIKKTPDRIADYDSGISNWDLQHRRHDCRSVHRDPRFEV